jgi:aminoglycoside phosphotransferase family enzyme/predicted kinase
VEQDARERATSTWSQTAPAVVETHSAVVFFLGDRAYKVKKPVDLGFLDFRSRADRQAVCHREVELNRRLAPDVYLGVADVVGPDGTMCDHLVVMRRMPADRRLATLIATGVPVSDELRTLARVIVSFHEQSERTPEFDAAASADAVDGLWRANGDGLRPFVGRCFDGEAVARVASWAEGYIRGRGPLFERRIADGRIVDGQGDLLADDIFCLDDGPRVLDCLEFDDDLRYGDVLLDIAFLAMDLERLHRPDLAHQFLADYRELSGDNWPATLAHHYIAYRAAVRAKVAAVRHGQGDAASAEAARSLLAMAHDHLDRGRVRLVLVGGLPGTGKSTLAAALADHLTASVLRSDHLRKEIAGIPAHVASPAPFGEGIYRPDMTDATYRLLVDRAAIAVALGESVVLDASWSSTRWRETIKELARSTGTELAELLCLCPTDLAAARIESRSQREGDTSDATPAIAEAMARVTDAWPTARIIDTSGSPAAVVDAARTALGINPQAC